MKSKRTPATLENLPKSRKCFVYMCDQPADVAVDGWGYFEPEWACYEHARVWNRGLREVCDYEE